MTTIYTDADLRAVRKQISKRWLCLNLPTALLLLTVILSFRLRVQWLTCTATLIGGVLLIAGHDLGIKPLSRYAKFLENCLHGRTRECELPFVRLSENVDEVEGVRCRQLLCTDVDAKGRPYERLFYFDAEKAFPDAREGDKLHIVHHDLYVANVYPI